MTRSSRITTIVASALSVILLLGCVITSPRLYRAAWALDGIDASQDDPTPPPTGDEEEYPPFKYVHYYTYDPKDAEFYFGPNAYTEATAAVAKGDFQQLIDYIVQADGTGDFFFRMKYDPALMAAIALRLDLVEASGEIPILDPSIHELPIGERADAAHQMFLKDSAEWERVWNRVKCILLSEGATWEIVELDNYTSAMYMVKDGLGLGVPAVIVRKTTNEGGYFLKFRFQSIKDGEWLEVYFRLNCGYQPIDPPGWNPPDTTPTPTPPPSDTPTPTPTDTPTPTPTSTPTPSPAPKDPQSDPQNRVDPTEPGADDFYSPDGTNNDPITTETPEPTSPSSYTPPSQPVATATPTPVPTSTPAPTATPTPAPTTAPTNSPTPTPVTGNNQSGNWKPLEDVANNNPAPPITNEPNSGDIAPPE